MKTVAMKVIRLAGKEMQELMNCGPKPIRHAQAVISKVDLLEDIEREATEIVKADEVDFSEESWNFLKDQGYLDEILGVKTDDTDTGDTDTGNENHGESDDENGGGTDTDKDTDTGGEEVVKKSGVKKSGVKKQSTKKPAKKVEDKDESGKEETVKKPTKKPAKKVDKVKMYSRYDAAVAAAKEGGSKEDQIKLAAELYAKETGKVVNEREAGWLYGTILKAAKVGNFTLDKDGNLQA